MTPRETILAIATGLAMLVISPAHALDPDWNGDPEPEVVPEPPKPPLHTGSDRDPVIKPQVYPCCIKDGVVVVKRRDLFSSEERTKRRCERAIANGSAVIYECAGVVSPEGVK